MEQRLKNKTKKNQKQITLEERVFQDGCQQKLSSIKTQELFTAQVSHENREHLLWCDVDETRLNIWKTNR